MKPAPLIKTAGLRTSREDRVRLFKALAHHTRLLMVDELARGERCVCELRGLAGSDMSTVSRHLAILRSAGIVAMEKRGLKVFYSLALPGVLDLFTCVDTGRTASHGSSIRKREY